MSANAAMRSVIAGEVSAEKWLLCSGRKELWFDPIKQHMAVGNAKVSPHDAGASLDADARPHDCDSDYWMPILAGSGLLDRMLGPIESKHFWSDRCEDNRVAAANAARRTKSFRPLTARRSRWPRPPRRA